MINPEELNKLSNLAKLNFSSDDLKVFIEKITSIMGMIDELKDLDCSGVKPLRSVLDMEQVLREDAIVDQDITDFLFYNVPASGRDLAQEVKCFVVPKVVE